MLDDRPVGGAPNESPGQPVREVRAEPAARTGAWEFQGTGPPASQDAVEARFTSLRRELELHGRLFEEKLARVIAMVEGLRDRLTGIEEERRAERHKRDERSWDVQKILLAAALSLLAGIGGLLIGLALR